MLPPAWPSLVRVHGDGRYHRDFRVQNTSAAVFPAGVETYVREEGLKRAQDRIRELESGIKMHRAATLTRLSKIDKQRARMMGHDKNLYALLEERGDEDDRRSRARSR